MLELKYTNTILSVTLLLKEKKEFLKICQHANMNQFSKRDINTNNIHKVFYLSRKPKINIAFFLGKRIPHPSTFNICMLSYFSQLGFFCHLVHFCFVFCFCFFFKSHPFLSFCFAFFSLMDNKDGF